MLRKTVTYRFSLSSSSLEAVILMNPRSFGKEKGKQKWLVMKKQEMRNRSRDKREERRDNIVVLKL